MQILNRLVFAQHDAAPDPAKPNKHIRAGTAYTAQELIDAFGPCLAGTNLYFGVKPDNANLNAFEANSMPSIQSWIDLLPARDFTLMLGVEPNDDKTLTGEQQLQYVIDHIEIVEKLGERLNELMTANPRMRVVVRYASEMNPGTGNRYAGFPAKFKESYKKVHKALKDANLNILMSFSPGINQNPTRNLTPYWPGNEFVDLVGCTWYYAGDEDARRDAKQHLDDYLRTYATAARPPCIDEMGGAKRHDYFGDNEPNYQDMFQHLLNLNLQGLALQHCTCFLGGDWGAGVTLDFLC